MSIKISILLIPYVLFLILWLVLSIVAVYHMLKFGFKNFITIFTTFIFIGISLMLLAITYSYIDGINWQKEIIIFGGAFDMDLPIKIEN